MRTATASYRSIFAIADFRALFAAQVVSLLGDVVAAVALTILVYQRTRSAALSAAVFSVSFVPYPVTGALVPRLLRRFSARSILVACDLAAAALAGVMTVPGMPVAGLLGLLLGLGLLAPVFQGVRSALMPVVLPPGAPYILGVSVLRIVAQVAQVLGYVAGGLLVALFGSRTALAADAASFAIAAVLIRLATAPRPPGGTGVPGASTHGLGAVLRNRPIRRVLLLGWLLPACSVAPEALAVPYVVHLGLPGSDAAYLLCGLPVGAIVADLVAARLLGAGRQRRIITPAATLLFVPYLLFVGGPDLQVTIGLLVVSGLGFAYGAGYDGMLIGVTSPALRTPALAASSAGLMFFQGLAFGLWGLVGEVLAPGVAVTVAGLLGLAALIWLRPGRAAEVAGSA